MTLQLFCYIYAFITIDNIISISSVSIFIHLLYVYIVGWSVELLLVSAKKNRLTLVIFFCMYFTLYLGQIFFLLKHLRIFQKEKRRKIVDFWFLYENSVFEKFVSMSFIICGVVGWCLLFFTLVRAVSVLYECVYMSVYICYTTKSNVEKVASFFSAFICKFY